MEQLKIKCFVFSWKGQYENALNLEKQLSPLVDVTVINSDDDNVPEHWVNIGNECYFSEQFKKALELFDTTYDVFFHVQADASYDDFESIIKSANELYKKYHWGVYAPNVDDTFYISSRTDVFSLEDDISVVATTDNTCWFVHKDIIQQMNQNLDLMSNNKLGWGWDLLICAFSHLNKRKVIRDYKFTVNHPTSTGYMKEQAEREMSEMFGRCSDDLKLMIYFIKASPINIAQNYGTQIKEYNNDMFVYNSGR